MEPTREALERSLVADPADLALHGAYADYLIEQGDVRGEYIRLRLLLASENKPKRGAEKALARWEKIESDAETIWNELSPAWLAAFGKCRGVADEFTAGQGVSLHGALGWLDRIDASEPTPELPATIAACPLAKLLREFRASGFADADDEAAFRDACIETGVLAGVRELVWHSVGTSALAPLLAAMPRLEKLQITAERVDPADLALPLPNLKLLALETPDPTPALAAVADNASFRNLGELLVGDAAHEDKPPFPLEALRRLAHAGQLESLKELSIEEYDLGDDAVEVLLASPLMDRLIDLNLSNNRITDAGLRLFAADPRVPKLKFFRLEYNDFTRAGLDELAAAGVDVSRWDW